ncbi:hypothetical protein D3C87_279060 [compost metagenome]
MATLSYLDLEEASLEAGWREIMRQEDERFLLKMKLKAFSMGRSMGKSISTGKMVEYSIRPPVKKIQLVSRSTSLLNALIKRSQDEP